MGLEVQIEKQLADFALNVAFETGDSPVGILGASGAGKSMTLKVIAGLEDGARGRIAIDGRVLFDSARGIHLPSRMRRVGMVFQNYALFPHLTVGQNIAFGVRGMDAKTRAARIAEQIAATHLAGFERRHPSTLSGGEQQRVALARALAPQPAALLLDEPFSALDTYLRSQLEHQLRETLAGFRGATLLVSHNLEEIYRLCGQLVVLDRGSVIARGSRDAIFRRPPNRRAAEITGCKNFSRAQALSECSIRAEDWGCTLHVPNEVVPALGTGGGHVGIRAHHLAIAAVPPMTSALPLSSAPVENVFPCWLADVTEGPFRVTLYLNLHGMPAAKGTYHLQAEVTTEHWMDLRAARAPWQVRLDPQYLFPLQD